MLIVIVQCTFILTWLKYFVQGSSDLILSHYMARDHSSKLSWTVSSSTDCDDLMFCRSTWSRGCDNKVSYRKQIARQHS